MTVNFHKIAKKWQKEWNTQKIYESDPNDKPKFFVTTPYPYANGLLHLGHTYTYMRVDAFARYKRMRGYNVLFPFAFHCTGTPITSAAKKVSEQESGQINTLKLMGFTDEEIPKFSEPKHWIKTFTKEAEKDLRIYGLAIDWRRTFITTNFNSRYDKFIKWQFNTLKEKGLVEQGEHPVVWNPKEQTPVGDHDRSEGEGETPQEMILVKFTIDNTVLPCGTFRPETIFGVTNIWIHPDLTYVETEVDGELWIVAEPCVIKLKDQKHTVKELKKIIGKNLIGKTAKNPITGKETPLLPATFVSADTGTGVVMGVPSHAPYDWIALKELQAAGQAKHITPISIISIDGFGEHPAIEICQTLGITNIKDSKLEEATQEVYKKEYHTGKFKPNTGYGGKTIQEIKPQLIKLLKDKKHAVTFYELINPVISRSLEKCHVKIVDNQWFIRYSDEHWKEQTMKALTACKIYPEKIRTQFEHVIHWLKDWACTREQGLGTTLPWDKNWKIESLSDSTIYPAFYTIANNLKKIPLAHINDKLFNYLFLGKGNIDDIKADPVLVQKLRREFQYWYPVDFRSSGKDLVQNHLTMYLFNHTGIFFEQYWPRGIGINGYVTIQKAKMSKSKGNFKTLRDLVKTYGPDIVRISILTTGEELNDVDWDTDLAESMTNKLQQWHDFALTNYAANAPIKEKKDIDKWMEHQLHTIIKDTTTAMEETLYRTALQRGFFDLQRHLRWYYRRTAGAMNPKVISDIILAQTLMLTPFTPHLCEEIWHKLGNRGNIVNEKWPDVDQNKINAQLEHSEQLMEQLLEDINQVLKLAKKEKAHHITLFVAADWKTDLCRRVKEQINHTRNFGEIIKSIIPHFKQYPDAPAIIQKLIRDPSKLPTHITHQEVEHQNLLDSLEFLKQEFGCVFDIVKEQESKEIKAKQAMPGKPAMLIT